MLALTPRDQVRVVILGQDPYHGPGQAEGLAFSVPNNVPVPPSLRNIRKELWRDLGAAPQWTGSLVSWAQQGVLLLNTALTVEDGCAASHAGWGWETLTRSVFMACQAGQTRRVFMLWGAHAHAFAATMDRQKHHCLQASHPSPLSALRGPQPFIGCGHFSEANRWHMEKKEVPIDWLG
jgi:uracil-DNA glycosylase